MNLLALDPANITGWATKDLSGIFDCRKKAMESKGVTFIKFKGYVRRTIKDCAIDFVVYEKPGGRFFNGVRSHANFEGVLLSLLEELGVDYADYSATEIKKYARTTYIEKFSLPVKGQMNKEKMIEFAEKVFDRNIIDDNHADAIWLYEYVNSTL